MEVIKTKQISVASRSAWFRRCRIILIAVIVIVGVLSGYYYLNKADTKITFTVKEERSKGKDVDVAKNNTETKPTANDKRNSESKGKSTPSNSKSTGSKDKDKKNKNDKTNKNGGEDNASSDEVSPSGPKTESDGGNEDDGSEDNHEIKPIPSNAKNKKALAAIEDGNDESEDKSDESQKTSKRNKKTEDLIGILSISSRNLIVGFGDSITRGSLGRTSTKPHPYSLKLQELLGDRSTMVSYGYSGKTTTELLEILPDILSNPIHQNNVSIVIVLGGTNDITMGALTAKDIVSNLISMHKSIHNAKSIKVDNAPGVYTVAMSVPLMQGPYANETKRNEINTLLRDYFETCRHRTAYVDLDFLGSSVKESIETPTRVSRNLRPDIKRSHLLSGKKLNLSKVTRDMRDLEPINDDRQNLSYWFADDVHPTAAGYDLIATKIMKVIQDWKVNTNDFNQLDC